MRAGVTTGAWEGGPPPASPARISLARAQPTGGDGRGRAWRDDGHRGPGGLRGRRRRRREGRLEGAGGLNDRAPGNRLAPRAPVVTDARPGREPGYPGLPRRPSAAICAFRSAPARTMKGCRSSTVGLVITKRLAELTRVAWLLPVVCAAACGSINAVDNNDAGGTGGRRAGTSARHVGNDGAGTSGSRERRARAERQARRERRRGGTSGTSGTTRGGVGTSGSAGAAERRRGAGAAPPVRRGPAASARSEARGRAARATLTGRPRRTAAARPMRSGWTRRTACPAIAGAT